MTNGHQSVELKGWTISNPGFQEDGTAGGAGAGAATEENRDSAGGSTGGGAQEDAHCVEYTQIKPYAGMPKEVLLLYSSQARYRVPREILFWLIVACMVALVALTATIIALSPPCLGWWRASPLYQVYPRSFKDSDGDGVGDLKGIIEQLSHFEYLNIKSVCLGPVYRSPLGDSGDGLKLIMDLIPNHTSDRHRWFNLSRGGDEQYKDYYIWTDCNATAPRPNNWFLKDQPDLNFRNPHVRREMIDVLRFWLEKGVDGFRMEAVERLLEASHLRDEPQTDPRKPPELVTSERDLHHDYTTSQLGLHRLLQEWRAEMDTYSREPGRYRFLATESYVGEEMDKTMMYYGTPLVKESDFPVNLHLLDLPHNTSGLWAQHLVGLWMSNMPGGRWPNWGEIGMENINVSLRHVHHPDGQYNAGAGRGPQRSPMQWSGHMNAGFNNRTNVTWLPVHPDYSTVNVETQKADSGSVLAQYRLLSLLRQAELPLQRGWFCPIHADAAGGVFAYLRELDGLDRAFLVLLNFGTEAAVTDLSSVDELPDGLTVVLSTAAAGGGERRVLKSSVPSAAGEGLVLRYNSGRRFHTQHAARCYVSEKACYLEVANLLYKC
ncbi:hypothetical protein NHX12_022050 [Muraenolepis orangiensis]|uniref:Glycosyl hydrolase family 13 catalytic domain-containing protein n=1 Tax=Muraenolepis orangiensis TaxID=630683 RepID=A0A9Q0IUU1_9TELE|nr:hypothetical protein NHX12_022050 [Muraenolepis orangiensis]